MNLPSMLGVETVLPFLVEVNAGLGEVHGTLMLGETELAVEFEARDSLSGLWRKPGSLNLDYSTIQTANFRKGLLFSKVVIEAKSIQPILDVKWRSGHRLHLGVSRHNRGLARSFVDDLNWRIETSEQA